MIVKAKLTKKGSQCLLSTEIGRFFIVDKPHYLQGEQKGFFELKKIYPSTEEIKGTIQIIMKAELGMVCFESTTKTQPPVEEETGVDEQPLNLENKQNSMSLVSNSEKAMCDKVGLPYPLSNGYKVDPTLSRNQMNDQAHVLSKFGFQMTVHTQEWHQKSNVKEAAHV